MFLSSSPVLSVCASMVAYVFVYFFNISARHLIRRITVLTISNLTSCQQLSRCPRNSFLISTLKIFSTFASFCNSNYSIDLNTLKNIDNGFCPAGEHKVRPYIGFSHRFDTCFCPAGEHKVRPYTFLAHK